MVPTTDRVKIYNLPTGEGAGDARDAFTSKNARDAMHLKMQNWSENLCQRLPCPLPWHKRAACHNPSWRSRCQYWSSCQWSSEMTKVWEGWQGVGALVGLLPQADRLQHRHHHVVLLIHIFWRYLIQLCTRIPDSSSSSVTQNPPYSEDRAKWARPSA